MVPMGGPSVCRMFAQLGNQAQLGAQGRSSSRHKKILMPNWIW
jgi:hypothetical protein